MSDAFQITVVIIILLCFIGAAIQVFRKNIEEKHCLRAGWFSLVALILSTWVF